MLPKLFHIIYLGFILTDALCDEANFCELSDEACTSAAYNVLLKKVISGNPAYGIESADPFHRDLIQVTQPSFNLTLNNPNMYGTGACEGRHLKIGVNDWHFSFWCPKLTLKSDYEVKGDVDSIHIEGNGRCEIVYNSYDIGIYGGYDEVTGEDGKPHFKLTFFKMETMNINENVIYKFDNLFNGDNEKSTKVHKYINDNWKKLQDVIGEQIIYSMMGHYMDNVIQFTKVVPMYEMFKKSVIAKS